MRRWRWRARQPRRGAGDPADARPAYVEQTVKRDVRQDEDQDPIADVMISGLRAAATLKDAVAQALGRGAEPAGPQHEGPPGGIEALKVMG